MKLTKERLKQIIKEEVAKLLNESLSADEKKEKASLKAKKDKTPEDKEELKTLQHKWMKEGKLSSALQERYGIGEKDAIGKVLWHSLNENGQIGIYDIKFGNTIIRNLTENDVSGTEKEHPLEEKHGIQNVDDTKRGQKNETNQRKT